VSEYEGSLQRIPASDRELIENFVKSVQAWAPASLTSIVLYGSVAKGIFPEEYDVDIVLFFSRDFDHPQFYAEVYSIIAALKPHRDMHVVLKWEGEVEPAYRQLIEEEGIPLYP
jgi:predicted nucleotidyltransferase